MVDGFTVPTGIGSELRIRSTIEILRQFREKLNALFGDANAAELIDVG
jgi:hypothetical protein